MTQAYWKGHPIYMVNGYRNGWALIAFYDEESPITGTGTQWVPMSEIVLEEA